MLCMIENQWNPGLIQATPVSQSENFQKSRILKKKSGASGLFAPLWAVTIFWDMDGDGTFPAGSAFLVALPDNYCFFLACTLLASSRAYLYITLSRATSLWASSIPVIHPRHQFVSILSTGTPLWHRSTQSPQSFHYSAVRPIFNRGNGGDARASRSSCCHD